MSHWRLQTSDSQSLAFTSHDKSLAGLAICQANGTAGFKLFCCGEDWNVQTDTFCRTLEAAVDQAELQFRGVRRALLNHGTAWCRTDRAGDKRAWDFVEGGLAFRTGVKASTWPGIIEPKDSITFDVSHFFDGSEFARQADEIALNVEVMELFRMCVLPGEKLFALDWQHPSYLFNPFGRFEFSPMNNEMVPVMPNGDYYIFLANDFRFGLFGHPWEETICVFGQPLLDITEREKPQLLRSIIRRGGVPV